MKTHTTLDEFLAAARRCHAYMQHLPHGPRSVLRASETARILGVAITVPDAWGTF
jgi:hypothetical protein